MASGQVVVQINQIMPPAANFAAYTVRAGGSTPAEQVPCWAFDAAADEYLDYYCSLSGYAGGGLTFTLKHMAATATTGGALIALGIRRLQAGVVDVDTAKTYTFVESRFAAPATSGFVASNNIALTSGTNMDGLVNNEDFILRVRRRGSDNTATTGDDMAGDWQLLSLIGLET